MQRVQMSHHLPWLSCFPCLPAPLDRKLEPEQAEQERATRADHLTALQEEIWRELLLHLSPLDLAILRSISRQLRIRPWQDNEFSLSALLGLGWRPSLVI